jgi:hypothetical protein
MIWASQRGARKGGMDKKMVRACVRSEVVDEDEKASAVIEKREVETQCHVRVGSEVWTVWTISGGRRATVK